MKKAKTKPTAKKSRTPEQRAALIKRQEAEIETWHKGRKAATHPGEWKANIQRSKDAIAQSLGYENHAKSPIKIDPEWPENKQKRVSAENAAKEKNRKTRLGKIIRKRIANVRHHLTVNDIADLTALEAKHFIVKKDGQTKFVPIEGHHYEAMIPAFLKTWRAAKGKAKLNLQNAFEAGCLWGAIHSQQKEGRRNKLPAEEEKRRMDHIKKFLEGDFKEKKEYSTIPAARAVISNFEGGEWISSMSETQIYTYLKMAAK